MLACNFIKEKARVESKETDSLFPKRAQNYECLALCVSQEMKKAGGRGKCVTK